MVGVFISVTTVPAAGNLALGIGTWAPSEILGSLEQLGAVNLAGMVLAGVLVLLVLRAVVEPGPGRRRSDCFARRRRAVSRPRGSGRCGG